MTALDDMLIDRLASLEDFRFSLYSVPSILADHPVNLYEVSNSFLERQVALTVFDATKDFTENKSFSYLLNVLPERVAVLVAGMLPEVLLRDLMLTESAAKTVKLIVRELADRDAAGSLQYFIL